MSQKIRTGQIADISEAWTNWTPTLAGMTLGNGTLTGKYKQIGKTVFFKIYMVFGSTSSVSGNTTFTLPVTAAAYTTADTFLSVGVGEVQDAGVASYLCRLRLNSTTVCQIYVENAGSTYAQPTGFSSTIPHSWGTGDGWSATGTIEAA